MKCYKVAVYTYLNFKQEDDCIEFSLKFFHKLYSFLLSFFNACFTPALSLMFFSLLFYSRIDSIDKQYRLS